MLLVYEPLRPRCHLSCALNSGSPPLNTASEPLKTGGGERRVALVEGWRAKVLGPAVPPIGLVSSRIAVLLADAERLS